MHIIIYNLYSCCPGVKKTLLGTKERVDCKASKELTIVPLGDAGQDLHFKASNLHEALCFNMLSSSEDFCHVEQLPTSICALVPTPRSTASVLYHGVENGVANWWYFPHQPMFFTEPSTGSSVFGGFGVNSVLGLTNFNQESLSLSAFFFFSPFPLPFLPPDDMLSTWNATWLETCVVVTLLSPQCEIHHQIPTTSCLGLRVWSL